MHPLKLHFLTELETLRTLEPKTIAILQSNYIPWKGYFDLIHMVDEFILYDDMQYTRRDWRNRNMIKTSNGLDWLTIPVEVKGKYFQKINETKVSDQSWRKSHWTSISQNYSKAKYFKDYRDRFEAIYRDSSEEMLSKINHRFLTEICDILGIKTKISWSMDYQLVDGKTERLAGLVKSAGGTHYISGPAAKDYIVDSVFSDQGIALSYIDYAGYPPYSQLYGEFQHTVTVLDLIFNEGPNATQFMKSFQR